jgi:hypothetical protein
MTMAAQPLVDVDVDSGSESRRGAEALNRRADPVRTSERDQLIDTHVDPTTGSRPGEVDL